MCPCEHEPWTMSWRVVCVTIEQQGRMCRKRGTGRSVCCAHVQLHVHVVCWEVKTLFIFFSFFPVHQPLLSSSLDQQPSPNEHPRFFCSFFSLFSFTPSPLPSFLSFPNLTVLPTYLPRPLPLCLPVFRNQVKTPTPTNPSSQDHPPYFKLKQHHQL